MADSRIDDPTLKVAIINYWLVGMRGGEKVLESLCRMFPQADLYTHALDRSKLSETLTRHHIRTTRVGRLQMADRLYQKCLPLMPRALEELDLSGYALVISSEAGPAKGVIPPPDAPHLSYCHSPMRYLWDQYHVYRAGAGAVTRALIPKLAHGLRQWDVSGAARVYKFAANSHHVANRIRKYWRRESRVVPPPVTVEDFTRVPREDLGDYYLWAGELAPYKRPGLAVEAFRRLDRELVVIGGPDEAARQAGAKARFLSKVPFAELKAHMARCRALIFPGEEDLGIVPVEVMASGRPVIGYGRGGIPDSETGLLFPTQSVEALMEAVTRFEAEQLDRLDPAALTRHAARFSEADFQAGIRSILEPMLASKQPLQGVGR